MKIIQKPPRLAERLFSWYCHSTAMEDLHGDLEELFYLDLEKNVCEAGSLALSAACSLPVVFVRSKKTKTESIVSSLFIHLFPSCYAKKLLSHCYTKPGQA